MSVAAVGKALRIRIDFPATTIGGMLLAQQLLPVAEPLFAEAAKVEGGRHVWVVELPDGVGIGAVIGGFDVMIRPEDGKVAIVLPAVVAGLVAARMRAAGVDVEVRRESQGVAVLAPLRARSVVHVPGLGNLVLDSA